MINCVSTSTLSTRLSARAGIMFYIMTPASADSLRRRVLPPLRLLCAGVPVYGISFSSPERHYVVRHTSHNWGHVCVTLCPQHHFTPNHLLISSTDIYSPVASSSYHSWCKLHFLFFIFFPIIRPDTQSQPGLPHYTVFTFEIALLF